MDGGLPEQLSLELPDRSQGMCSHMLDTVRIEDIDQLLNELEQLAHASASRSRFYAAALERVKFLLGASAAAVMVQPAADQWLCIAALGSIDPGQASGLLAEATDSEFHRQAAAANLLAVPMRRGPMAAEWHRGALVVELSRLPSGTELEELVKLCAAFAEVIALRQLSELETFLDQQWLGFQRSMVGLAHSRTLGEGAYAIANDLSAVVRADRVALVRRQGKHASRLMAVSGVVQPEWKGAAVVDMERVCRQAMQQEQPLAHHRGKPAQPPADERSAGSLLMENYICVPFRSRPGASPGPADMALLLEWSEYEQFLFGSTTLNYIMPALCAGWQQHVRWLSVPTMVRRLALLGRGPLVAQSGHRLGRLLVLALLLLVVSWGLCRPVTLRVEAEGTLQPVEQRAVYAAIDGVVEQVFVSEGQRVQPGERLVQLRSPSLEIEIQEVLGEMNANREKREGLNVAINQLTNDDSQSRTMQSRLSSEIRELETQLQALQEKHQALLGEQQKLLITAPIEGIVVARQIDQFLASRPVRQGDALLRVVQLDGPWHLELLVADQDSGYVKQKLFGAMETSSGRVPEGEQRELEFVIASQPDVKSIAHTSWVSESARNPRGEGMFVDVLADVEPQAAARGHMGATVYAYFDCGQQPLWFVWSRPLVEEIQRRLWF